MRLPKLFLLALFSVFAQTIAYLSTNSWRPTSRRELKLNLGDLDGQMRSRHRRRSEDAIHEPPLLADLPDPVLSRSSFFTASMFAIGALTLLPATTKAEAVAITEEKSSAAVTNRNMDTDSRVKNWSNKQPDLLGSNLDTNLMVASESNSLQESISGFFAGGALAGTKTLVKYPLDTVTVRLQVPNSDFSVADLGRLFSGSYNGITLSLLSNIPGGAVFFAVKDAAKASLNTAAWTSAAPKWVTTTMAVGAAMLPYWIIRNPSEVIKVRQQVGIPGYGEGVSAWDAIQLTFNETRASGGSTLDGIQTFYTGYWENVIYGLPADVIKFVAYEAFTGGRRDLSPLEGARAGAFATVRE
jgi:hypothetical protein